MEMIQQLFMVAFVFSILAEKLACVTKDNRTQHKSKTKSKSMCQSQKKVKFAVHDQVATVINNKLVKLGAIKRPTKKQMFIPTNFDLDEVYLGANWIGEELMIYKELGLHLEHHELGFGGIQDLKILNDEALTWLAVDDNIDDQTADGKNDIMLDFAPRKSV